MTTEAATTAANGATSAAQGSAGATNSASQTPAAQAQGAAQAATAAQAQAATGAQAQAAVEDAGLIGSAEAEKAAAAAAIEIKLPDGFKADDELMKGFGAWAKESGLDSAKAQKMVDLYAQRSAARAKSDAEAFVAQQTAWKDEVKKDAEIGGQNFDQSLVEVKRFFSTFDKDGSIRKGIAALGLGNHPALVRLAVRAAKLVKEDGVGANNAPGSGERSEQEMLAIKYPSMFPKQ